MAQHPKTDHPNIILCMGDDHALEAISCYDSYLKDFAKTPNIDQITKEGLLFNNCFCNNSICSPSRASIITGQYSHKNGVLNLGGAINDDSPYFSVELQKAGYQTCIIGKWHLATWPRGFDKYWIVKGQGTYFDPVFFTTPEDKGIFKKGYATDVYTDLAIDWLKNRDVDKPFLLCLYFKGPHHPYDYPERNADILEGVMVPEPSNLYEDLNKTDSRLKSSYSSRLTNGGKRSYFLRHLNDTIPPMGKYEPNDIISETSAAYQHMMHKYIRCITANDQNVGRILDYTKQAGLDDNTVVIYTSDQGYWLGQHGFYDKRLILEESLKMPFLIRYPKIIKPGSRNNDFIMNIDFGPTLLDLAGVTIPESMQGKSFVPLLKGKKVKDFRDEVFYCYWASPPHWGLRTERYKLIHFPGTDEVEFYDLKNDPHEMHNLAMDPHYQKEIRETQAKLDEVIKEIDIQNLPKPRK